MSPCSSTPAHGNSKTATKLGIYIQVPFCRTKCTYCNFSAGVFPQPIYKPYVEALCRELIERAREVAFAVDTVYLGGGTPSLLETGGLLRILETLRQNYGCALEEVTLEADPETVSSEKAVEWRAAGIDRISLGAQSFSDKELRSAGRLHRCDDIFNAVNRLRGNGFSNISLDLIAGLPLQTGESWNMSLENLLRIRPQHVSIYLMEIDEGSRLGREVLSGGSRYCADALPGEDAMVDFYESACVRLASEGYEHYEISNWSVPAFRSRHNLKYWRREPYLGIGAGAHSFDGRKRWANLHDPAVYLAAIAQGRSVIEQEEILDEKQALEEELFLGLRQLEGVNLARVERQYHVNLRPQLERLLAAGLVELDGERLRLAPSRIAASNEAFVELLG